MFGACDRAFMFQAIHRFCEVIPGFHRLGKVIDVVEDTLEADGNTLSTLMHLVLPFSYPFGI